MMVSHL